MAGQAWLVDSRRIAMKIKSASEACDPRRVVWKSNPTRACPSCNYIIDNSDVALDWPGLPRGVKFDPTDQELLWHLLAKGRKGDSKPHPFIDEFIPTLEEDDGICYTHPQKLPGVKQDGSVSHFFHRTFKAYNTGTRKRRKIHNDDLGDVRWHKTGKTKPVVINGVHQGCKKIMVLYMSMVKGGKPEKTNWVMHQHHLGTGEDEKDGEFVVSKIFYQQQSKQNDKNEQEPPLDTLETIVGEVEPTVCPKSVTPGPPAEERPLDTWETIVGEAEPTACPKSVTPDPPAEKRHRDPNFVQSPVEVAVDHETESSRYEENGVLRECKKPDDDHGNHSTEDPKWWEGESQFLLDSQQLAEGMALCDEFLRSQSQSSCGDCEPKDNQPSLSDYAHMGVENLKKDLEECQNLSSLDPANIYLDTPPDMRLSQLEFGSQDSFLAWGGNKVVD